MREALLPSPRTNNNNNGSRKLNLAQFTFYTSLIVAIVAGFNIIVMMRLHSEQITAEERQNHHRTDAQQRIMVDHAEMILEQSTFPLSPDRMRSLLWNGFARTFGLPESHRTTSLIRGGVGYNMINMNFDSLAEKSPCGNETEATEVSKGTADLLETHPLHTLWDNMMGNQNGDKKDSRVDYVARKMTLLNAIPRLNRTQPDAEDITLLTHCSVDRMEQIIHQAERWQTGPMSVAVYLQSRNDIDIFLSFFERKNSNYPQILRNAAFHVYMEPPAIAQEMLYPNNIMRNIALEQSETDFVLAMDADLVTEYNSHDRLMDLIQHNVDGIHDVLVHEKTFLILPAFEGDGSVPKDKAELVDMYTNKEIIYFHQDDHHQAQGCTNFKKYFGLAREMPDEENQIYYHVKFAHKCEPYVVAYKYGLPRYFERLRGGRDYDKVSFFTESHFNGYRFRALRDFFVFHENGNYVNKPGDPFLRDMESWTAFVRHLMDRYNASSHPEDWSFVVDPYFIRDGNDVRRHKVDSTHKVDSSHRVDTSHKLDYDN